jgi:hypothetical protein
MAADIDGVIGGGGGNRAIDRKFPKIIQYLLEWGVDPDVHDPNGLPALHKALTLCSATPVDHAPITPTLPPPPPTPTPATASPSAASSTAASGATSTAASTSSATTTSAESDDEDQEFGLQVAKWLIDSAGASVDLLSGKANEEHRLAPIHIAANQGSVLALDLLISRRASMYHYAQPCIVHLAVSPSHRLISRYGLRYKPTNLSWCNGTASSSM